MSQQYGECADCAAWGSQENIGFRRWCVRTPHPMTTHEAHGCWSFIPREARSCETCAREDTGLCETCADRFNVSYWVKKGKTK